MIRKLTPLQQLVLLNACFIRSHIKHLGWRDFIEHRISNRDCTSTVRRCIAQRWIKANTWKEPFAKRNYHLTELGMQRLFESGWTT